MTTVLITGGTGFIGKSLTRLLVEKGYHVIILTRDTKKNNGSPNIQYAAWDINAQTIDTHAVQQADYIIHLAGAGVGDKRWTAKRKKEIVDSRTKSSDLLLKVLKENANNVKAVFSASGIGWYGEDPVIPNKKPFIEPDPADEGFLGETCRVWEAGIAPVTTLGKRLAIFRTGIVLGKDGGALKEFIRPVKFGIATVLGSGKQIMSWIHIEDVCRLYLYAIENEIINGVYNAVTAMPVSNKELILQLAKKIRGRFFLPVHVPAFVLKLVLGEMSIEILKSATVSCEKIGKAGFIFQYPSIQAALEQIVTPRSSE